MRYTGGMVELSGSITQAETMERSPTRKVFPRSIKSGPSRGSKRKESEPWDVALNFIASVERRRIWRQRRQIACESCVGVNIWGVWTGFLSSLGGECVGAKRFGTPKGIEQKLLVTQHGFSHLKAHPILIQSSDVWASNQAQIESNHPISSHAEQQRECAPASSWSWIMQGSSARALTQTRKDLTREKNSQIKHSKIVFKFLIA